jgi:hypothetical protein
MSDVCIRFTLVRQPTGSQGSSAFRFGLLPPAICAAGVARATVSDCVCETFGVLSQ